MTSLTDLHKNYLKRFIVIQNRAQEAQSLLSHLEPWRLRYLTEGIISDLWQSWCTFCRNVILFSCEGTVTRNGSTVISREGSNSWQRIGYEAACAARGANVHPTRHLSYRRHEPTWGDQNKIIDIVMRVGPTNSNALLTAFGLPVYGPRHLQIVRNACSHKNIESIKDVRNLSINYFAAPLHSPSDLAWFIDRNSNCCGIYSWCDDLSLIVEEATKTL